MRTCPKLSLQCNLSDESPRQLKIMEPAHASPAAVCASTSAFKFASKVVSWRERNAQLNAQKPKRCCIAVATQFPLIANPAAKFPIKTFIWIRIAHSSLHLALQGYICLKRTTNYMRWNSRLKKHCVPMPLCLSTVHECGSILRVP